MAKARFLDDGRRLAAFSSEFLVRCPGCGDAVTVSRQWDVDVRRWTLATIACVHCGFSRRQSTWPAADRTGAGWEGPVVGHASVRCGGCGRRLSAHRRFAAAPASRAIALSCDGCGRVTQAALALSQLGVPQALVDSCFGLPLWLRTPCAGRTLWALNPAHLAYLAEFLGADLRERGAGAGNGSVTSALPSWLKVAKHRREALRAVSRLQQSLAAGRPGY